MIAVSNVIAFYFLGVYIKSEASLIKTEKQKFADIRC